MHFSSNILYQCILLLIFTQLLCTCKFEVEKESINESKLPTKVKSIVDSLENNNSLMVDEIKTIGTIDKLKNEYPNLIQVAATLDLFKVKKYRISNDLDSALYYNNLCFNFFKNNKTHYKKSYLKCLQNYAVISIFKNDSKSANQFMENSYYEIVKDRHFAENKENFSFLSSFYGAFANIKKECGEPKKAALFCNKYIYYLNRFNSTKIEQARANRNYAIFLKDLKIDSSLFYAKESLKLSKGDTLGTYLSNILIGEIYNDRNLTDSALTYLKNALKLNDKLNVGLDKELYYDLAFAFEKKGRKKLSNDFFLKVKSILKSQKEPDAKLNEKDFSKALLEYCVRNSKLNDTPFFVNFFTTTYERVFNLEKANAIKKAEVEFNVKLKNDKIKRLLLQNKLKEIKLKETLMWFSLVIFFLFLFGLLSYILFRQKHLEQEKEKSDLQQRFLLSQMNPHFMSNALSVIQCEILEGNSNTAFTYLNKYTSLTRQIFENSRNKLITLIDEIKVLENYLLLQKIRFDDKFDFSIQLYPDYMYDEILIPPMIIQPSLENAIEHGFANIDYKGILNVIISKTEDFLTILIEDNGQGLKVKNNNKFKNSISTNITMERLKMFDQEIHKKSKYTIENIEPNGVLVTFVIPIVS